jgi:MFS family permease
MIPKKKNILIFIERFPKSVIALSIVSFLMNISTSMITSTAPNFVKNILNNNVSFLVTVRCLAEGFSYFIKVLIGICSDITKKRKLFLIIGYGGVLIVKPLFIIAASGFFTPIFNSMIYAIAQIFDRLLNAVRDTPRDSLIADATVTELRSQSFGLRKFFAALGSQCGGLLALIILFLLQYYHYLPHQYSILYLLASLPAFYSVYILYTKVQEAPKTKEEEKENWFSIKDLLVQKYRIKQYIFLMFIIFIMSLGKFNEICLFQLANNLGYSAIGVYMFFYSIVSISSYFLSLTKGSNSIIYIFFSIISLLITNGLIGYSTNILILIIAIIFSGIYVGITESIIAGAITIIFPQKNMRATLFGIMNTVLGISICSSGFCLSILVRYMSLQRIYLYGIIPPLLSLILFIIFLYTFYYPKTLEKLKN